MLKVRALVLQRLQRCNAPAAAIAKLQKTVVRAQDADELKRLGKCSPTTDAPAAGP